VADPVPIEPDVDGSAPSGPAEDQPPPRKRARWKWATWPLLVVVIAGGLTVLALRWQERELIKANRELAQGDARRALALASYFLDRHPDHTRAQAVKARALCAVGQPEEAVEIYERIGAATLDDMHAWARAYLLQRAWSRAMRLLEQVVRMDPNNADALHELASCRIRLGVLQEALDTARRFSELPGQRAKGNVLMAAIYNDLDQMDEAIAAYERAVELTPEGEGLQVPPEEFFMQFGAALVRQGQGAKAVPWLEKSVAIRPVGAAYHYLGNAYSLTGNTEAAEQAWRKAVEIDPIGVSPREALANLALATGDIDAALEWLSPLERVAETRHNTAYLFQRLYAMRGDEAAAKQWQQRTEEVRRLDQRESSLEQMMHTAPYAFWSNVVRAHRFASAGNWLQAEDMLDALAAQAPEEPYVQELREAVRVRGPLPSLDPVPLKQF
jgi:tetratricopeptide (TPR) repeat protein